MALNLHSNRLLHAGFRGPNPLPVLEEAARLTAEPDEREDVGWLNWIAPG
jgi:hypothetical protein